VNYFLSFQSRRVRERGRRLRGGKASPLIVLHFNVNAVRKKTQRDLGVDSQRPAGRRKQLTLQPVPKMAERTSEKERVLTVSFRLHAEEPIKSLKEPSTHGSFRQHFWFHEKISNQGSIKNHFLKKFSKEPIKVF